jgi:hypothetical protein
MRKFLPLLLLFSLPAMAQEAHVETVFSNAGSLNGLWKIQAPQGDKFLNCRIEHAASDPAIHCFERPVSSALTLRDNRMRIAFYPTLLQTDIIEGETTSPDSGRILLSGIPFLRHEGLSGMRLTIAPQAPDIAGKAPVLRTILSELANGRLSHPYDTSDDAKVALPQDMKMLGAAAAITYLGMADSNRDRVILPDFFAVYLVSFQNGQRFCGLHQRDDGVLDALRCV